MNESDEGYIDYQRDELMLAARRLPAGIAPGRDLWPGIEKAIEETTAAPTRGMPGWNRIFAQAAAVVLLVGGSSGITWLAMNEGAQPLEAEQGEQQLAFQPVAGSFGSQYHLGPEFVDARNSLATRLDDELERLPPETRQEVQSNLDAIRGAIREINLALADEPDNALLQELLLNAYRDELTLMRRVDGLANTAMRRRDI